MDPALVMLSDRGSGGGSINPAPSDEAQTHEEECLRMAAFRIRETANRIGLLAERAQTSELRRDLQALHKRLLNEEQALRSPKR